MYDKPKVNLILNVEKSQSYSSKIRNKTRMPTLPLLFNIILEALVRAIKQGKEIKGIIQIGMEEVKYFCSEMK